MHWQTPGRDEGFPKIDVEFNEFDFNATAENGELMTGFGLEFPEQIKIITQSKAVDINSFIGNIGGYIGLFLGKFIHKTFF